MTLAGHPGYREIAEYYEHLIRTGHVQPGRKLPTEEELCGRYGVTRTTVRRAYAVLARKGLIVKRQGLGTFVAPESQVADHDRRRVVLAAPRTLADVSFPDFLLSGLWSYHYYQHLEAVISALARYARPFEVRYFTAEGEGLHEIGERASSRERAGILALAINNRESVDRLTSMGVPVVFLDSASFGREIDLVRADNRDTVREATRHVLRHTDGPLAFIGSRKSVSEGSPHHERYLGFGDAHRELGRTVREDLFVTGPVTPEAGREAVAGLLERSPDLGGVVCSDDLLGFGVLQVLAERGIPVPDRVSVFGFGDGLHSRSTVPSLSTVAMDLRTMGLRAVELLEERILNPHDRPRVVTVPCRVCYRQSTAPVLPERTR